MTSRVAGVRGNCLSQTYDYLSKNWLTEHKDYDGMIAKSVAEKCMSKIKPIQLGVQGQAGCNKVGPIPAGIITKRGNPNDKRFGIGTPKLPGQHENILITGSQGNLEYKYKDVKEKLAAYYDKSKGNHIGSHVMSNWEKCWTLTWLANFWIRSKKYKNALDGGMCHLIGCRMNKNWGSMYTGHLKQNIDNLFNPWNLIPAEAMDGGAVGKCNKEHKIRSMKGKGKPVTIQASFTGAAPQVGGKIETSDYLVTTTCNDMLGDGVGQLSISSGGTTAEANFGLCGGTLGVSKKLIAVGYKWAPTCPSISWDVEGSLSTGAELSLKYRMTGSCQNGAVKALSGSADSFSWSFTRPKHNCIGVDIGAGVQLKGGFKIGFCVAGDVVERVFASNSFRDVGSCTSWAKTAVREFPCTYTHWMGS